MLTLIPAVLLGDVTNYSVGRFLRDKVSRDPYKKWIKEAYIKKTQAFYEKHGGKTVILARFVPIVRTFAPFVAGVGIMNYRRFISFSVMGVFAWVPTFLWLGHWFGNLPQVKQNFHIVIFGIILVSVLPIAVEWLKSRKAK